MSAVFLKLLNMSITASWLILAVLAARLLLKKAPRWIVCLLWGLAALRLLIPFSLQSVFSVVPSAETVPVDIAVSPQPAIHTGFTIVNHTVNPILTETFAPDPTASVNPLQTVVFVASVVWAVGASIMLLYALISFLRLRKTVAARVPIAERVFACDEVKTPFILGVIRPKIYVPSAMGGETLDCVLRHEEAHLKRRDHWWKPLGFLLLSLYWFNPLCWVAYILLCRDIETACDEKVIRDMDRESVAAYSQALLDCGFQRKTITACPLAFGEVGVKQRVKGILNYKKPAFWIILIAIVVCVVIAVCLLTDPRSDEPPTESTNESSAESTSESLPEVPWNTCVIRDLQYASGTYFCVIRSDATLIFAATDSFTSISAFLDNKDPHLIRAEEKKLTAEEFKEFTALLDAIYENGTLEPAPEPDESRRTGIVCGSECSFWLDGAEIGPYNLVAYNDYPPEEYSKLLDWMREQYNSAVFSKNDQAMGNAAPAAVRWFDVLHGDDQWSGTKQITIDAYPDAVFECNSSTVTAIVDHTPTELLNGMPIDSVYVCDLNGDGAPEICATVSYGSGMIDTRLRVHEMKSGVTYVLSARGKFDYCLNLRDGSMIVEKRRYGANHGMGELVATGRLTLEEDGLHLILEGAEAREDVDAEREQYAAQQYATKTFVYVYPGSNLIPMHTDNVYYCDLNGDGVPERCITVSIGSGIVDERICVYDGQTGVEYELSARGEFDYRISQQIGELLIVQKRNYNEQVVIEFGTLELVGDVLRFVPMNPAQNITELLTRIYTDDELTAITQFKGTLSELGQKYPIEFLRESNLGQYVVYRSESDLVIVGFELDGSQQALPFRGHMAHSSEEFRTIQVGDTLDEVRAFDPDGIYLWLYTGVQLPPVSTHCTTDGYFVSIEYSDENIVTKIEIHMI